MKMDRKVKWVTVLLIMLLVGCFTFFYVTSSSSYLPAWLTILFVAIFILMVLSIPRYASVTQTSLEVHCVLEVTILPLENIKSITPLEKKEMKWCIPIPIIGVWGFFGYYGYYFDLKNLKLFKLYAAHWGDFVKIEDIYEEVIVVSLSESKEVIDKIASRI